MKDKAVVVGGSNGIGLSISKHLIDLGYFVIICDITSPDISILPKESYQFIYSNLIYLDENMYSELSNDKDVKILFITAGIGRIADFQYHHISEIEKTFEIDSVGTIKIISLFYHRILSKENFFTGVIGSIAGWLVSPTASVYSAAKAATVRFIESVNIELEVQGSNNRILDVSPGSFGGSKFYGGNNNLGELNELTKKIIKYLFERKTLYIPKYNDTFKEVLSQYRNNPHDYGIHSWEYKKNSNRVDNRTKAVIGYLSGTFDLFHVGHLNMLKNAKSQCDYLIVGVHKDGKWKNKETFIPLEDRKEILKSCKYVDKVIDSLPEDCDVWELLHYNKLFVGSDYKGSERFKRYEEFFKDKNVQIVYFPYTKNISSTKLREKIKSNQKA